jgi:hypothetical protein
MKALRALALVFLALAASPAALSQGNAASLINMTNGNIVGPFVAGFDTQSLAWDGGRYAWGMSDGGGMCRIDLSASPPAMDRQYAYEGPIFISGGRAIVADALLDVSVDPPRLIIALPEHSGVAFFAGGNRAILINDFEVTIVNGILTASPTYKSFPTLLPEYGLMVAVNPAGTKAVVTLDDVGGVQVLDIRDITAPRRAGRVFPVGTVTPEPLAVTASLDGKYAIFVNEGSVIPPLPPEAVVVDISVDGEPWVATVISLEGLLVSASSIVMNPATGEAVVAGDDAIAIITLPSAVRDPSVRVINHADYGFGTTKSALAINGAGTHALVLHEDRPMLFDVNPKALVFALQETGTVSAAQTVTVVDRDEVPVLVIRSITTSGPFVATSKCPATLDPGPLAFSGAKANARVTSCTVDVKFAPTTAGNGQLGWLTVATDVGSWVVRLTGDAATTKEPRLVVDPSAVAFGDVVVGQSATRTFNIISIGNSPLVVTSMAMNGPFTYLANCITIIPPGQSCTVLVAFNATALGAFSGELVFRHNGPGGVTKVPITATGAPKPAPRIQFSSTRVEFPNQGLGTRSVPRNVFVKNVGNAPLHVANVASNSPEFSVVSQCASPVDPGKDCQVTVTFAPFAPGPRDGTLVVSSDAADRAQALLPMLGTGCRPFTSRDGRTALPLCAP